MSTVAWDGKTLAADRQGTSSGTKHIVSKIFKLENGDVVAFTGGVSGGRTLKQWHENGADPEKYPAFQQDKDRWGSFIVLTAKGELYHFEDHASKIPVEDKFWAWGSGRDLAIGAMAAGANASQAVQIASQFDNGTGFGVDAFDIP